MSPRPASSSWRFVPVASPSAIYLHGNNKTEADLRRAIEAGVGFVVCDSFDEIERLDGMLDRPQDVMIRVTPGIKANTHSFIQTGQLDSKFGFGLDDGLGSAGDRGDPRIVEPAASSGFTRTSARRSSSSSRTRKRSRRSGVGERGCPGS